MVVYCACRELITEGGWPRGCHPALYTGTSTQTASDILVGHVPWPLTPLSGVCPGCGPSHAACDHWRVCVPCQLGKSFRAPGRPRASLVPGRVWVRGGTRS